MIYRVLRFLFHLALRVFFKRMEVEGLENIPRTGPVLFLPNHPNALVDALVVLKNVPRPVSLTARSTLGDHHPVMDYLMRKANVIRFHRKQDRELGADRSRNIKALAECMRRLKNGEAIIIFPEGQSHSDPGIRPFRWGAARLALDYTQAENVTVPLNIVPVGLYFPYKARFRSDVWVCFGKPVNVQEWVKANSTGGVVELIKEIEDRVRDLTLNFEKKVDSILLTWVARVLVIGGLASDPIWKKKKTVAGHVALVKTIKDGYDKLKDIRPREVEDLKLKVAKYRSELSELGIAPGEVFIRMSTWHAAAFIFRETGFLLVGLPMAVWGFVNHFIPYQLVRLFALTFAREKDQVASNVVFPGVVVFPLFYIIQIAAGWFFLPAVWAGLYTASLPLSAYFILLYRDRAGGILRRRRAFWMFMNHPELQERLISKGRSIIEDLRRLGEELNRGNGVTKKEDGSLNLGD
ncbi:MAG: lysophospholipid acyltransferase family protein [bacterium]